MLNEGVIQPLSPALFYNASPVGRHYSSPYQQHMSNSSSHNSIGSNYFNNNSNNNNSNNTHIKNLNNNNKQNSNNNKNTNNNNTTKQNNTIQNDINSSISSNISSSSSSNVTNGNNVQNPTNVANTNNNNNNNATNGFMPVHLISSDLWEAITGEHLSPISICQILSYSIPLNSVDNLNNAANSRINGPQSLQSIQYVMMSKDRIGSRSLQQKLEDGSQVDRNLIFDALHPNLNELVYDQAANFVIQKLCEFVTPAQQTKLLEFFLENIERVVDQPNSCRVLQRFIECTSVPNVEKIFQSVKPGLLNLCLSQNGNHIVQRFIEMLPDHTSEVIECVIPHLVDLAIDNCGCRVVQRLFEKYSVEILAPLVDEVLKFAADLATNQYGNYVVQNILEAKKPEHISRLVKNFKGHFYAFSTHKFASNVVEKVIRAAHAKEQNIIFTEIIGVDGKFEEERIEKMIVDQFGNYVMQRIIEFGTESQQNAIADVVYNNYNSLISVNYAKHVIVKLEELGFQF